MWDHIFGFVMEMYRRGPESVTAAVIGVLLGALMMWQLQRRAAKADAELATLKLGRAREIELELTRQLELSRELELKAREAGRRLINEGTLKDAEIFEQRLQRQRAERLAASRKRHLRDLSVQIRQVVDTDGRIWESDVPGDVPRFVPRSDRRATIVAVINLKGGVGKTTLSANLSGTFAARGESVLAVDLDFQHSLSDLCFTEQQRDELLRHGCLIDRLFEAGGRTTSHLPQWMARVGDSALRVVVADEGLETAEERVRAAWLLKESGIDARFLLRAAIHTPAVADEVDWIFLDCPPRLTTAAVNALCAADYVLIPTILDAVSSNAVPRLLQWLTRLKHKDRLCPQLELLGVLANKTHQLKQLTAMEATRWDSLQGQCSPKWPVPIHFFEQFVPSKVDFARAAAEARFAIDQSDDIRARFLDLADEIRNRVPQLCKSAT
ncbi:MAG: ParA family protein [Planctomycetaceae bacterium]|nr:ParA family protein [Planctomycetaceae bacterium]